MPGQDETTMRLVGEENRSSVDTAGDGDRLVFYEYCISLIFFSLRRPSALVQLRPGQKGWVRGIPYTLVSLLFGWWCIPWGLIYTPLTFWTNLSGGREIPAEEQRRWNESAHRNDEVTPCDESC
jgi:hypothetical protein